METLYIVIGFAVGYFVISKSMDLIKNRLKNEAGNVYDYRKFENSIESADRNILTGTLNILGLISTAKRNDYRDELLTLVYKFIRENFNSGILEGLDLDNLLWNKPNNIESIDLIMDKLISAKGPDNVYFKAVTQLLMDAALLNGIMSLEDELILVKLTRAAKIEFDNPYKIFKQINAGKYSYDNPETSQVEKESYYRTVLGLTGEVSESELFKCYKEQALRYHPAALEHLGPDSVILAESKFKEINAAFEYFKKRYEF